MLFLIMIIVQPNVSFAQTDESDTAQEAYSPAIRLKGQRLAITASTKDQMETMGLTDEDIARYAKLRACADFIYELTDKVHLKGADTAKINVILKDLKLTSCPPGMNNDDVETVATIIQANFIVEKQMKDKAVQNLERRLSTSDLSRP